MADEEDFKPRPKPMLPLDALSVNELEAHIGELKAEIAVCERLVVAKKGQLAAADTFFRGKQP